MNTGNPSQRRPGWSWSAITQSFRFAFSGLCHALRTERNLQIHCFATAVFLVVCLLIRPSLACVSLGIASCCMVWCAELFNTAIERVTDLTTGKAFHEWARQAKDLAAGAVFVIALGALFIGLYIMANSYPWHWYVWTTVNWQGAVESGMALALVVLVWWLSQRLDPTPHTSQPESSKEATQ
jgi:diacylglycerol kinase